MERKPLLAALRAHTPFDATEARHVARTIAFVEGTRAPFSRRTLCGHVTGSAIVTDAAREHLLLLWHETLQRWLQPGGHCEPSVDSDTRATAWRELTEETGITPTQAVLAHPAPFDIDVHVIPARGAIPAHPHHDIRYHFLATPAIDGPFRWVPIAPSTDISLQRLAQKLRTKY